jgi:hypothetical protein
MANSSTQGEIVFEPLKCGANLISRNGKILGQALLMKTEQTEPGYVYQYSFIINSLLPCADRYDRRWFVTLDSLTEYCNCIPI